MGTDFDRERDWWDSKAIGEEQDTADERVNRDLRWREINKHLPGVHTVAEIGAATGAFTIPLAKRGFRVTHIDLSPKMLELARSRAADTEGIQFIEANAVDLSRFSNKQFDLVLNMDGAISFCGDSAHQAVRETCRISKKVVITVSNRALMIPLWIRASLETFGDLKPVVDEMFNNGIWHQDQFPENKEFTRDTSQKYLGNLKAFTLAEITALVEGEGMRILRASALGSLANLCGEQVLERTLGNPALYAQFLEFCDRYDREILRDGPGTKQRAGTVVVAESVVF